MTNPSARLAAVLAGFLLWAIPIFGAEAQWVEVKSPHFTLVTDAGERRGREVAIRFEQMRAVFGALFAKSAVNIPVPLQIVAFRNTKELLQFAPLWNGKPTDLAGLFLGNSDRNFILLDLSVVDPWAVVFHEYAHLLMSGNLSLHLDPWFEEGFAEYFATAEVDGKEARIGKVREDTYRTLERTGLMPTADLFRVQQHSRTYNESGDRRSGFYAQSAMVVHYIYDNDLFTNLIAYFELANVNAVPIEEAIQQAFGKTTAQLDSSIRDYVRQGRYQYHKMPTPAGITISNYITRNLSVADSSAALADVHLYSPDYAEKAPEEYQAILKIEPRNALALRGLGYSYLLKRDFEQAGKYFQQAAEANSNDPRVHYYAALLMSRARVLGDVKKIPIMTKELETAIALDPYYADAYSLLSFAYAYAGEAAKGLQTMRKALSLNPGNETYIFNLAQMYLNNRNPDEAISIFEGLRTARNPTIATRSSEMMEEAQGMKSAIAAGENVVIRGLIDTEEESTEQEPADAKPESAPPEKPIERRTESPEPNAQSPKPELSRESNIQSLWPTNK
jgi:tetratricopeptide (TPR) repeat protein